MNVSVAVISYNSEKTIIETLNSILQQSYGTRNIELIISDDGSSDNTVLITDSWIKLHENSFERVNFIKHSINNGVSKNCNSAWKECTCEWIKTIAADDVLLDNCLSDNVKHIRENSEIKILFSIMMTFDAETLLPLGNQPAESRFDFFKMNASQQYKVLLTNSFNCAPSSFINRETLSSVGYADERFMFIEDLPLWLRFTSASIPLRFMKKETVKYRIGNSLTSSGEKFVNINFLKQKKELYKILIFPSLSVKDYFYIFDKSVDVYSQLLIAKITKNKKGSLSNLLSRTSYLLRPYWYKVQFGRLRNTFNKT
jgi:glycosyltransferase involved in cell wall biosynthesis